MARAWTPGSPKATSAPSASSVSTTTCPPMRVLIAPSTRAILTRRMSPPAWTREDVLLAGGVTVALAASADVAWSLHARFAADLTGLSVVERAGAALWDFRPLTTAVFAAGAVAALTGLRGPAGRFAPLHGLARDSLALLAAAPAALALVVLALAAWVAAAGELGGRDELGFVYSPGERAVTLVTQLAAWLPLAVFLSFLAFLASRSPP